MPARKASGRKYSKGASKSVESAMRRKKSGTLRSGKGGKGGKVKSRKQAIAIGLSEARKQGAKVPKKKYRDPLSRAAFASGRFRARQAQRVPLLASASPKMPVV